MTNAHRKQINLGHPMTCPHLAGLLVFFAALVPTTRAQAQLGLLGNDLPITIESQFLTLNDNFIERIGIDFDFDIEGDPNATEFGFVDLNNDPHTALDIPVSLAQARLEAQGAVFPDPAVIGPAEVGGSINFMTDIDFETIPRTMLSFELRSGITAPPGTAGRAQNQGVTVLKLNKPTDFKGEFEFEVETSFHADIVEPQEGKIGIGALVEVSPNISDFRFFNASQRFFYESDSLGPFGDLYSAANDFSTESGVLQFRGQNTVLFTIFPEDLVDDQVVFQAYNDIFLENSGMTSAQVDATQTATFTLRSLTPGVTFQKSTVVPEPGTIVLLCFGSGLAACGLRGRRRRTRA